MKIQLLLNELTLVEFRILYFLLCNKFEEYDDVHYCIWQQLEHSKAHTNWVRGIKGLKEKGFIEMREGKVVLNKNKLKLYR